MVQILDILNYLSEIGVEYVFIGDAEQSVESFSSSENYQPNTFTWIQTASNIPGGVASSGIKLAFVGPEVPSCAQNMIRTQRSKYAFFACIEHFYYQEPSRPPIGQFTYLSPAVKLGKNVRIGHNCTLDGDITIGDNTIVWNGVSIINRVTIGKNCEIQSGAVIGHDGYGYVEDENHVKKMIRHFGGVIIEDDVLIGSNVCVVRGTIDNTVIGRGAKIDNLTHVAHNCQIGSHVSLAFPCRLGGSSRIMENAYIAAGTLRDHCVVEKDAFVGMGAIVVKDVAEKQIVVGNPARPFTKKKL